MLCRVLLIIDVLGYDGRILHFVVLCMYIYICTAVLVQYNKYCTCGVSVEVL